MFLQIVHGMLNNTVITLILNIPTHNVLVLLKGLCGQVYQMLSIHQKIY